MRMLWLQKSITTEKYRELKKEEDRIKQQQQDDSILNKLMTQREEINKTPDSEAKPYRLDVLDKKIQLHELESLKHELQYQNNIDKMMETQEDINKATADFELSKKRFQDFLKILRKK